ncbi:macrophage mannose receptor 1-like [Lingula anatina]|uniref:Macrophage mannose receptor 1-like n=1 Tax=Lingula anatina TaxID=7574 RepID=A0A2R2MQ89_LINAN|nr:macrophage mannose receptor 1-like [Lingula anatina]|eukprot:XP_023932410.1 macrophage mannose receptor 1-like [Lingula anatina]
MECCIVNGQVTLCQMIRARANTTCVEIITTALTASESWATAQCSVERPYICKKPEGTCAAGWKINKNMCYQLNSNLRLSFVDAVDYCNSQGGSMVTVYNPEVQNFLKLNKREFSQSSSFWIGAKTTSDGSNLEWVDGTPVSKTSPNWSTQPSGQLNSSCVQIFAGKISAIAYPITFWLGGNDLKSEGGWRWTDGSPFSYLNWDVGYFSEPNSRWSEDCMQITSEFGPGLWNDITCDIRIGYICKKKGLVSTTNARTPSTTPLPAGKGYGCWPGWKKFGDGCFLLVSEETTWMDARTQCRLKGGDLASVMNERDQAFLTTQSKANASLTNRIYWLGLNDLKRPMTFEWTDGREVTYTNWNKGEPNNNVGVKEDCVTMNADLKGAWNDDSCDSFHMYICQTSLKVVPVSSSVTMLPLYPTGCPSGTTAALGSSCYSFVSMGATWADAERYCQRGGGHLAALKNFLVQAYFLTKLKQQPSDSYWIGLSNPTGIYRWSENSSAWYTNWDSSHSGNGVNRCVTIDKPSAKWKDRDCGTSRTFICEYKRNYTIGGGTTPAPTTTTTPVPVTCPADWVERNGYCYKAVYNRNAKDLKTWLEARADCRSYGGDLLSIHSQDEETFVKSSRTFPGPRDMRHHRFHFFHPISFRYFYMYGNFWIGLNNRDTSTGHVWSDGTGVDYTNWATGEPNNHNGQENCVELIVGRTEKWKDSNCNLARNYFCKMRKGTRPPVTPTTPIPVTPTDCGDTAWLGYGDNCFYVSPSSVKKNWYDARDWCRQSGGDLASIHGRTENGFITSQMSKVYTRNTALWIGLNELNLISYTWSDGTPADYDNWNKNEPNDWNGGQRCVDIYTGSGTWNDDNCGDKNGFICKRHKDSRTPVTTQPTPALPGNCPRGYYAIGNKCYGFYGDSVLQLKNWTMARDYCAALGKSFSLATITNELEQSFITIMLKDKTYEMWIGLNDKTREGTYHWVDNQPFSYTNWDRGEPHSNAGSYGDEDCVLMKTSTRTAGKWQSRSCSFDTGFVCQTWKGFTVQPNLSIGTTWRPNTSPSTLCDGKPGYTRYLDACYKVDTLTTRTWDQVHTVQFLPCVNTQNITFIIIVGVQYCRNDGATAAVVTNNFEQAYLNLLANDLGSPVWLGLYYDTTYKIFQWKDSPWSLVFVNWASNVQLDDPGRRCVSMNSTGQWVTTDCNTKLITLCKYTTVTPSPTPPEEAGYCPDDTWFPKGRYCYYIKGVNYQNWAEASVLCYKKGGQLASITSQAETNFILDTISTMNQGMSAMMWIGLIKKENSGFGWYDGTPFNYQNWMPGQPSNRTYRGAEECGAMSSSSGQWNDVTCGTKRNLGFICKRLKMSATTPFIVPSSTSSPSTPTAPSTVSTSASVTAKPRTTKSPARPNGISIKPQTDSQTQDQGTSSSSLPLIIGLTLAAVVVVAVIGAVVFFVVCRNAKLNIPFTSFDNAAYEKDNDRVRINGDLATSSHDNGILTSLKQNGNHGSSSEGTENPVFQEESKVSNGHHGNANLYSGSAPNSEC